jgi:hypothetical protein
LLLAVVKRFHDAGLKHRMSELPALRPNESCFLGQQRRNAALDPRTLPERPLPEYIEPADVSAATSLNGSGSSANKTRAWKHINNVIAFAKHCLQSNTTMSKRHHTD